MTAVRVGAVGSLIVLLFTPVVLCYNESVADEATTPKAEESFVQKLQVLMASAMDKLSPDLTRKLLRAEVSATCSFGLLKLSRGIRSLEPWALRLIDSMGKYPTGLMQATKVDLGAFDECLETVVHDNFGNEDSRGQYCNLDIRLEEGSPYVESALAAIATVYPKLKRFRNHLTDHRLPPVRLGICVLNDCNEEELQEIVNKLKPTSLNMTVNDCVTSLPVPMTNGQKAIIIVLGVLAVLVVLGTAIETCTCSKKERSGVFGFLVRLMTSFSLTSNTRTLISVPTDRTSDAYTLRFFHGLRFFSMTWIVLGHCYGAVSPTWSRLMNNVLMVENMQNVVIPGAYIAVDTFFFLSAFLMCYTISKQKKPAVVVFLFAVIRRFIRTVVPLFFVLMCMYLLPLITSGPDAKAYFEKFYNEMDRLWLYILLQVQNYKTAAFTILVHLWYLSVDFQLFLISVPIVIILKNRRHWAIGVFTLLSIVGCSVAAWQISGTHMTPFVVTVTEEMAILEDTLNNYYLLPFYHAVCYFSGCIAFFLLQGFKEGKVPKLVQTFVWCFSIASGLCCVIIKFDWYLERNPTSEFGNICMAFFDRILWSVFLVGITLACASGRGGIFNKFLAWNAFVPLSRLTFGVYLIHAPFIILVLHIARERIFYSHFILVSMCFAIMVWSYLLCYIFFVICEAPTARLDKLIFMGAATSHRKKALPDHNGACQDTGKDKLPVDLENGNSKIQSVAAHTVTCHL